jgi:hypothetical protein
LGMGRDAFSEQSLGNIAEWILSVLED